MVAQLRQVVHHHVELVEVRNPLFKAVVVLLEGGENVLAVLVELLCDVNKVDVCNTSNYNRILTHLYLL